MNMENPNNKAVQEEIDKLEDEKAEAITTLDGDREVQLEQQIQALKQKLETIVEQTAATPKYQKDQITNQGGTLDELNTRTESVDSKIEEIKESSQNGFVAKLNRFVDNKIYELKNKLDSNNLLKYESLPALSEEEILQVISTYKSPEIVDSNFTNKVNGKYEHIQQNIEKFVFDEKRTGIQNVLQDKNYPQYKKDLQEALKQQFGDSIIVRRLQGYQGDGRGVLGLMSTSYNSEWGNVHDDNMKVYLIKTEDIPIAGFATEAELLVAKTRAIDIKKMLKEGGFQSMVEKGQLSAETVANILKDAGLEDYRSDI